ncbi:unnamed protein product [Rotaria sp. Silwood1]|nr:unnamed protein product [Rotaria sp. Silwood1]CAF1359505.1 unnamed protein product [Rotaria sp. Silwood1]CAF3505089.1 unnamed protein product [Rotaria sp. Silwood1]CAF3558407.1 unnamed protein product [Rotaria sp. Silwood1]CAF4634141.1 unnamed protein product [Rotaria sp. Silwood1]
MSLLYGETECFHLPTEPKGTACRPLILNTSSIYINIQCQNEWYDCPLQYRIETQCVPRPNIRKRFSPFNPKTDIKLVSIRLDKPENDDSTPIKIVFGFITDKFPMDYTSVIGWHTISYAYNHSVLWIKRHTGYYCIDGEETKWQGTLAGDDGHYRAVVGFENVGRNDRIQIDVRKMTDVKTDKISTQINVLKNNQTTKVTNFYLPKPVPKQLYPGEMNLIDLL